MYKKLIISLIIGVSLIAIGTTLYIKSLPKNDNLGVAITPLVNTMTGSTSMANINTSIAALNASKLENSDFTGSTGITYAATGTISFDCSEVDGTGINCSGENITLDATGDWTGTFDSQEGSYYLARANHTGTQATSTITDFNSAVTGLFSSTATGLSYSGGVFSLTSGYNIPTTASTSAWNNNSGTVTNVGMIVPAGLSVSGVPITSAGTSTISYTSGYSIPLTASTTEGSTAYGWGNHAGLYPTYAYASSTYQMALNFPLAVGSSTHPAETDPVFLAASTSLAYQPIGSYLTAETDPVWLAASTTYAKLASPTFTGTFNFATASGTAITATNFYGTCSAAASDSTWTTHNSYPANCAGVAIGIGDTLTCTASSTWDTAYTDRLKWDGGATGLTAATGRTSLGLGTMALEANTGSTTITTLGTIGTGIWNATSISNSKIASSTEYLSDIYWTGVSTNLVAATGRTSLGLTDTATIASTTFYLASNPSGYLTSVASDATWTLHNSYPSACSAGQYVSAIGDTLTCGTPAGGAGSVWATSSATQLYVTGYNVGIGTTTPNKRFVVASTTGELFSVADDNTVTIGSGTVAMVTDSSGNVGISTSTPESKLDVWGTSAGKILTLFSNAGTKFMEMLNTGVTTLLGTWDFSGATVKQHVYPSFTWPGVATTTTATTTIELGTAYVAELWNSVECFTSSSTAAYEFSDGTNKMNSLTASTTVGRYTLSTNNTFTAGEKRYVNIGILGAAKLSCTIDKTVNN